MKAILISCLLAVGFGGGWFWARHHSPKAPVTAAQATSESALSSTQRLQEALAQVQAAPDAVARRLAMLQLIQSSSSGDLKRIMLTANDRTARLGAAQQWAEKDPQGMFDFLTSLGDDELENFEEMRGTLFRTWARHDAQAAIATARQVLRKPGFEEARTEVFHGLVEIDPEAAFTMLSQETGFYPFNNFKKSAWAHDPSSFVQAAAKAIHGSANAMYYSTSFIDEPLKAWIAKDLNGAMEWAKALPAGQRSRYLPSIIGTLAASDLSQATKLFESLPASREREKVGPAIVRNWAEKDPQAALDWLEANLTGGKGEAYATWIAGCAKKGMDQAASFIAALPDGQGRDRAIVSLANEWANKDLKATTAWLKSQPASESLRQAFDQISYTWMEKDMDGYMEHYATAPVSQISQNNSYQLVRSLEDKGEDKAIEWINRLPEDRRSDLNRRYMQETAYKKSAQELLTRLESFKDPNERRAMLSTFASSTLNSSDRDTKMLEFAKGLSSEDRKVVSERLKNTFWSNQEIEEAKAKFLEELKK